MQISTIAAVCVIISACFGVLDGAAGKLGLSVFEMCFAAISYLALSAFSVYIVPELSLNAAVLFLPMYFAILSSSNREKNNRGGFSAVVLFSVISAIAQRSAVSYFPLVLSICYCVLSVLFRKNTAFTLMTAALLPIAVQSFISVFDYMTYSYTAFDLSEARLLDTQITGVIFTTVIMTVFASDSKVIKA